MGRLCAEHSPPPTHPRAAVHQTTRACPAPPQNPAFLTLRKIEAAREIASTVAASANRIFLNSDSLLLNLADYESTPGKRK